MKDVEFMNLCKEEVRADYLIQTGKRIFTSFGIVKHYKIGKHL